MVEEIKSPFYSFDGIHPAYMSGEWQGSKPNHFGRTRLLLRPIRKSESHAYYPLSNIPRNKTKLLIPKDSQEEIYIPHKKQLQPFSKDKAPQPRGRKFILPNYSAPRVLNRNISTNKPKDNFVPSGFCLSVLPNLQNISKIDKKHKIPKNSFLISNNNNKKVNTISNDRNEYLLEDVMTRKKRVPFLAFKRNFLKGTIPGEKNYRYVEESTDFYKQEGLIVGSTNQERKSHQNVKSLNFYETLDLKVKSLDDNKLWKSKVIKEMKKNDTDYVTNLEEWENNYIGANENGSGKNDNKTKEKKKQNNEKVIDSNNDKSQRKVSFKA